MSAVFFLDVLAADAPLPPEGYLSTLHASEDAQISLFDAGIVRGDGVFETLGVSDGHVQAERAHLARLAHSAALLDLPVPNLAQWSVALRRVASTLPSVGAGSIRLSLTRGVPGAGPSAWLVADVGPADYPERSEGIAVVTLQRGLSAFAAQETPWLLAGAKTLSYAVNMAALREARTRDADDVIFISTEGLALEGPTSSLLVLLDGVFVSPPQEEAILAGTTVDDAFAWLRATGRSCEFREIPAAELSRIEGAWLLSSLRLAAPIHTLDGVAVPRNPATDAALVAALAERTS